MILEDGKHYNRGTVLPIEMLPLHLRTEEYIVEGVVSINQIMPIDVIEISDDIEEASADIIASPMKELTIDQLQEPVRKKPEKLVRRKIIKR